MRSKEASGAACSTALSTLVSCRGRKPLGMTMKSATVSASVPPVSASMNLSRFSAQSSER